MNIHEVLEKIKPFYTLILILVMASIFFAFWRLSTLEKAHGPIRIENAGALQSALVLASSQSDDGAVVGSKSGRKYYYPWCGTVKRIKSENQVHFDSIEAAKAAGFTPGGNCKGLK